MVDASSVASHNLLYTARKLIFSSTLHASTRCILTKKLQSLSVSIHSRLICHDKKSTLSRMLISPLRYRWLASLVYHAPDEMLQWEIWHENSVISGAFETKNFCKLCGTNHQESTFSDMINQNKISWNNTSHMWRSV